MKKLITLLLALLFIFTACTPAIEEIPQSMADETEQAENSASIDVITQQPIEKTPKIIAVLSDDSFNYEGVVSTFEHTAMMKRCIPETAVYEDAHEMLNIIEDCNEKNDADNTAIISFELYPNDEECLNLLKSTEIPIVIWRNTEYELNDESMKSLDCFLEKDYFLMGEQLAKDAAEKLNGKFGKLFCYINSQDYGYFEKKEGFTTCWQHLSEEYNLNGIKLIWTNIILRDVADVSFAMSITAEEYDVLGIVGFNSSTAEAYGQLLNENKEVADWYVSDSYASEESIELLKAGKISIIVDENLQQRFEVAIDYAKKLVNRDATEKVIKVPFNLITKDNAQAFYEEHFA